MKQFIILCFAVLMTALCFSSCEKVEFKLNYDFNIEGRAAGDVAVAFPGGSIDLKGNADLDFNYGNLDTTKLFMPKLSNKQLRDLHAMADDEVFSKFSATAKAGGTYWLLIDCVVTEEATGAELRIKKILTNEE